jgi:hypothetical protein
VFSEVTFFQKVPLPMVRFFDFLKNRLAKVRAEQILLPASLQTRKTFPSPS